MKKRIIYFILYFFIFSLGFFMFVFGEYDDSPGAQLIGLIVGAIGIAKIAKLIKNK